MFHISLQFNFYDSPEGEEKGNNFNCIRMSEACTASPRLRATPIKVVLNLDFFFVAILRMDCILKSTLKSLVDEAFASYMVGY